MRLNPERKQIQIYLGLISSFTKRSFLSKEMNQSYITFSWMDWTKASTELKMNMLSVDSVPKMYRACEH